MDGINQVISQKDQLGIDYCYVPKMRIAYGEGKEPEQVHAAYYISRYPISRSLFIQFIHETNYDYNPSYLELMDKLSPDPDCPATPISWWDSKFFIRWLRHKTNEYYSLPTELEWEAASRGSDGRKYPWGNSPPTDLHASYSLKNKRMATVIVGTHPLGNSPFGLCDTAGNTWEWCLDSIDDEGEIHVLRGGSCQEGIDSCTCTSRSFISPANLRVNYASFRLLYLPDRMFNDYCEAHQA